MQILGYFITSVGTMLLLWYCCEKLFAPRRHTILATGFCFVFAAVLSIAQTWLLFDKNLNSLTNIVIFFALTFLYSKPWTQRLFIAFLLFVLSVLGEGSGCLFVQILYGIDLKDVNETILFPVICLICVTFQAIYTIFVLLIMQYLKKHPRQVTTYIFILIAILAFSIIDLLVTFADTAYLIPALILSALLIAAIAGCIYLFTDQLRVQRERLQLANLEEMLQDQVKHYTALYEANRQVAVQRHDLKNILLNVRSYIQVGEYEKLDKYVAGFQEKVQPSTLIDNGMPFIDAVLSAKMAEHAEIPFENDISMLTLEKIKQPQIAFILAGALDNAIEACEKSAKPFIRVHIGQHGRMISLVVENAADQPVRTAGDRILTTKADDKAHGYGVKSMMQMAEQLHGMLTWRQEKQVFTLSVLMQDIGA